MYDVFSLPDIKFPGGFLWGSATAGHQIEGDNIHCQRWPEEQAGRMGTPSGKACDHYRLYKEDISLFRDLGHRAFRLSIEWSRIEPREGDFDRAALAHYIDVLSRLRDAGMKTFVTLHHFTHPLWFEQKGGFLKKENLPCWERYLSRLLPEISPLVDSWNVINEFNIDWRPEKVNFIHYHARAYRLIKQHSRAEVSSAHAFPYYVPSRVRDPFDRVMADYKDLCEHEFFFHAMRTGEIVFPHRDAEYSAEAKGAVDYWAVNYYTRHMVDARRKGLGGDRFKHKELKMIKANFYLEEMFPEGLTANLERLSDKPVYITENGCCCDDDRFRIVYLALHLSAMKDAIDRGVDLRGFLYWSAMDNYEWGSFLPRFGLVHVDFETFKRTPKPSAHFYREIIGENGFSQKVLRKYLTEMPSLSLP
jgi:beta-glucosidase